MIRSFLVLVLLVLVAAGASGQCPDPLNLVSNCGFEVNDDGWMATRGDSVARSTAASRTGLASLLADAGVESTYWRFVAETCVNVVPSTPFDTGAFLQLGIGSAVECRVVINEYELADCVDFVYGYWSDYAPLAPSGWPPVDYDITTDVNTNSLLLGIDCKSTAGDFQVFIDDAYLGPGIGPIFADGFESSDTSSWSAVNPP